MGTVSIEPGLEEQRLLADTFRRARQQMTRHERLFTFASTIAWVGAVAALWATSPPRGLSLVAAATCTSVLALATLIRFQTPLGFTVPTQLAFVPLLFAVPVSFVPVATVIGLGIARLPDVRRGRLRASRILLAPGNAWFAIGPTAVFVIAGVAPRHAGPALLVGALAAQFTGDFAYSALRDRVVRGARIAQQLSECWVYLVDAALSGVALEVARNVPGNAAAALTLVPLLCLLAVFARERHRRLEGLLELNAAYRGTALVLGDVVEADDGYTGAHSRGVVELALAVGELLRLPEDRRRNLEFAALLHDLGKIAIPKEIINKPGKLDPDEWTVIKTHTLEGQRMLDRVGGFMRDVGLIVRSHHERWDGGGYPDGLAGETIPLESRIIACCDTWNAMRTDRSYRKARGYEEALEELQASAGTQLDSTIVAALVAVLEPEVQREPKTPLEPAAPLLVRAATPESRVSTWGSAPDGQNIEDARAANPIDRLLEDSWDARSQRASRRELVVEGIVAALFLAVALPWALPTLVAGKVPLVLTIELVGLYAIVRTIKFPIGAGSMVPSYLVLVPMLLLLPPAVVPLLTAGALVLGAGIRVLSREGTADELLFSVPDAWHAIGPAAVLSLAGNVHGLDRVETYAAALLAGFVVDLVASTLREALAQGVAPSVQGRVILAVGLFDACIAPLGFVVALASRSHPAALLLVVPFAGLLRVVDRDRSARIAEAQDRLRLVAHERTRLQAAVHRLGDAFAAKLDIGELSNVLVRGGIDALDADAGCLLLADPAHMQVLEGPAAAELASHLRAASGAAQSARSPRRGEVAGVWTLAIPFTFADRGTGTMTVARYDRAFRDDEQALMSGLVQRAQHAMTEILATHELREQALTDPLTGLGNRRKLADDLAHAVSDSPATLVMLFDLNGFKAYNDTFGHLAGDAMLARLGQKLAAAVARNGSAYRLGGDEFCVLLPAAQDGLQDAVAAATDALEEHGERFTVTAAFGTVLVPHEAQSADYALQLADQRMYSHKQGRPTGAGDQAHDVLIRILRAKQPVLTDQPDGVAELAVAVGRRMGLAGEHLDELTRGAALHDIGKVGLPDAILTKPGPLEPGEWAFIHQHTVLGERILSAAPALRPVATIVRATHERWDGSGYPDGLRGEQIPLAARVIAVCDAYVAMTSERAYRAARSSELARRELSEQAGSQFDPAVVAALLGELDHPSAGPHEDRGSAHEDRTTLAAKVVSHVQELLLGQPT